jgi:DNA-binding LytR/AlgR family response regulator
MRILLADDDPLTADLLATYCRKMDRNAQVEHVADGAMAGELLRADGWDLIFLDLDLPGISGRELVALVPAGSPVIIVTGDPAFAADAFRHDVADYLVKPVPFDRFAQAWRKALDRKAPKAEPVANRDVVFVRTGNDIVRISLGDIRFIRSESNYVRFMLPDREITSLMSLKDLEGKLPADFVRVHRSYIINLRHVEKLDTNDVKIGRELIPVSETYRNDLLRRLDLL